MTNRPPQLALGTAPIGDLYGPINEAVAIDTVTTAIANGVTLIDTAPWYGLGLAEHRVGLALRGVPRADYAISTKVGYLVDDGEQGRQDFSADGIRRSLDGSLKRLGVDRIDIVHIHDPDDYEDAAIEHALPTLVAMRAQGVIGAIGAGMNAWSMLARFADNAAFDVFMLAGRYTLLEQDARPFLDLCATRAIPVNIAGVFNSGILATGARAGAKHNYVDADAATLTRVVEIEAVCVRFGVALPAAALQFAGAHPAISRVVVGAASPAEVAANIDHFASPIPPEFWQVLGLAGPTSIEPALAGGTRQSNGGPFV